MPPRAAQLAVRDRLEAERLLARDDTLDLGVLDARERPSIDLAARSLLARALERGRAQQAADVIGAKRRGESSGDVRVLLYWRNA